MRITPSIELEHRVTRLQELMIKAGLEAVIILQNADLFYFTGSIQSGNLYVPCCGQPLYMVRREAGRARMESGLKEVLPFNSMKEVPAILSGYGYFQPVRIGMEFDVLPVAMLERYRKVFPNAHFMDASSIIRQVRMIKSHYEVHILQDAAHQVNKVVERAKAVISEGMTDLDLAAELENLARKEGHLGLIRMRTFNGEMMFGHTFSGVDSAVPTYTDTPLGGLGISPAFGQGAGLKKIERDEPIVIDFAGSCDGYLVDMTRMFAIGGISAYLKKAYDDMLRIQDLMKSLMVELPTWGHVYDECLNLAAGLGYKDSFMGAKGTQVSFIGHGVGVEIDEYPFIARGFHEMRIEPGMVFAFEPKAVFPGVGSVGIENTFYISTDGSLKQLTDTSEEFFIIST